MELYNESLRNNKLALVEKVKCLAADKGKGNGCKLSRLPVDLLKLVFSDIAKQTLSHKKVTLYVERSISFFAPTRVVGRNIMINKESISKRDENAKNAQQSDGIKKQRTNEPPTDRGMQFN